MNANLITWLKSAGLDEQRAGLYLAALSRGESRASDLAKALGISRTAVYDNLRYLEERGYVQLIREGKRQVYVALHPNELQKKIEQQYSQLNDLLPDLLALHGTASDRPFVQMFQGRYAAREVYEDILRVAPKEYCYISSSLTTLRSVDIAYMRKWVKRRVAEKIKARGLRHEHILDPREKIFESQAEYLRELRYLPLNINLPATIYVYGSNIGVFSAQEQNRAFIIYSHTFSQTLHQIFELLWGMSQRQRRAH